MDPMMIAGLAQNAPGLFSFLPGVMQAGVGLVQMNKGKKMLNGLTRPEYEIPNEIKQANTLAAQEFGAVGRAEINAGLSNDQATANMANMALQSGYGAGAAPALLAQQQQQQLGIQAMADEKRQRDLAGLMRMQETLAQYKDTKWQMDKFAPYVDKRNEGRQLVGAGMQNAMGGLTSIASVMSLQGAGSAPIDTGAAASSSADEVAGNNVFKSIVKQYTGPGSTEAYQRGYSQYLLNQ